MLLAFKARASKETPNSSPNSSTRPTRHGPEPTPAIFSKSSENLRANCYNRSMQYVIPASHCSQSLQEPPVQASYQELTAANSISSRKLEEHDFSSTTRPPTRNKSIAHAHNNVQSSHPRHLYSVIIPRPVISDVPSFIDIGSHEILPITCLKLSWISF